MGGVIQTPYRFCFAADRGPNAGHSTLQAHMHHRRTTPLGVDHGKKPIASQESHSVNFNVIRPTTHMVVAVRCVRTYTCIPANEG